MKLTTALVVLGAAVALPQDHFDIHASTLDIDSILKNPEKLKMYSDCLLDVGECDAIGTAVKNQLPQALATGCGKCTPPQKLAIRKILRAGRQQLPEDTEKLIKKYDPEGQYSERIEKILASTD